MSLPTTIAEIVADAANPKTVPTPFGPVSKKIWDFAEGNRFTLGQISRIVTLVEIVATVDLEASRRPLSPYLEACREEALKGLHATVGVEMADQLLAFFLEGAPR